MVREQEWQPISTCPDGVEVWTLSPGGQKQKLTRRGRLFWGGDMYVYYTPTHWAPSAGQGSK